MNKLIAAVALAFTAMTSTGCFTVAGGVIGSQTTSHESVRLPDGSHVVHESTSTGTGMLIGAALDVLTLYAISQVSLSGCSGYGGGEGGGGGC
jgi:hypothetical protein